MTFDWQKIAESERALRQRLTTAPIIEKLRVLDALYERTAAIRSARFRVATVVQEKPETLRRPERKDVSTPHAACANALRGIRQQISVAAATQSGSRRFFLQRRFFGLSGIGEQYDPCGLSGSILTEGRFPRQFAVSDFG
jgi:hypothetical protein